MPIKNIINDKNVTFCVQSVLHLQPHTLEVSFATVQLLYQLCTGQACPIPQQSGVVAHRYPYCLSCKPLLAVCPRSCSPLGWDRGCWVATDLVEWSLASRLSGARQFREPYALGLRLAEMWSNPSTAYIGQKISRKQYVSIILTFTLTPGSTKWRFVRPSADTPTDTMTDLLYVGWVQRRRSAACVAAGGGHVEHKM